MEWRQWKQHGIDRSGKSELTKVRAIAMEVSIHPEESGMAGGNPTSQILY
jgi:hypothetical protein